MSLGYVQLQRGRYPEAERNVREALQRYEKTTPDIWQRYNCESLLGATFASQHKFSIAEPLLISGYNGLLQRLPAIPAGDRPVVDEAGHRLVKLYEDTNNPSRAEEWKRKLASPEKKRSS